MYVETNLDMNAITNVFDTTLSGTIRIGGKLYNSTTGEIFTDDVEIIINSDYEIVDVLVAGQSVSGVYPAKAVNGVFIGESTEVGKTFTNTTTPEVPHLWTSNCMYREVMQRECNYPQ